MMICMSIFFFSSIRRHTRWPRDWSSDVCSSDLAILARVADVYEARAQELAGLIATEMGKPLQQGLEEARLAGSIYRWYATHGPELLRDEQLDPQGAKESLVQTEPIGPLRSEEHTSELQSRGH